MIIKSSSVLHLSCYSVVSFGDSKSISLDVVVLSDIYGFICFYMCTMFTGMIDDHDECGWVNVSSGTGSPGFSQTNSTEP